MSLLSQINNSKKPSKYQWRQFFSILNKKEKALFGFFLFCFVAAFLFLTINFYLKNTEIKPAFGGIHIEGVVGSPREINPVLAASDIDRDLVQITFSGLMKYDNNGQIIPDLIKEFPLIKEDGKIFEITLKDNLFWSDGHHLTADDVIFTIKTIQNPDYRSPLRANWLGVKTEKISEQTIVFELQEPSLIFLEILTLRIIPEHIWKYISVQDFSRLEHNLFPISSGPFKVQTVSRDDLGKIKSLTLVPNPYYHKNKPFLNKIVFNFYQTEKDLLGAVKQGNVYGFAPLNPAEYSSGRFEKIKITLPRYFAVFFNPEKHDALKSLKLRQALNYATDKKAIIENVLKNNGAIVNSPLLPEIYGIKLPQTNYNFDLILAQELLDQMGYGTNDLGIREKVIKEETTFTFTKDLKSNSQGEEVRELQKCLISLGNDIYPNGDVTGFFGDKTKQAVINFQEKYAEEILKPGGFKSGTGLVAEGTRKKLNELCGTSPKETQILSFVLATVDQPKMIALAEALKDQWGKIGIQIEIEKSDIQTFQYEIIRPRQYDLLLFGNALASILDPFPFWHSSQIYDPGSNLSMYENKKADELLLELRKTFDEEKRKEIEESFQEILIEDAPAVFLIRPEYVYLVSQNIKGPGNLETIIDPSRRFSNIENWHLKTKRIWSK